MRARLVRYNDSGERKSQVFLEARYCNSGETENSGPIIEITLPEKDGARLHSAVYISARLLKRFLVRHRTGFKGEVQMVI